MRDANQPFDLCVFGMSYRSAPFELLEQAALNGERLERFYELLAKSGVVRDAFVVSTCNRTEVYASGDVDGAALGGFLRESYKQCSIALPNDGSAYSLSGNAALEHLYRVTAGLDSMMLGENQIVGQVKSAYEQGAVRFPTSSQFDRVMQGAFRTATRARSETEIASGAVSVASAAVHLASRIFGDMKRRTVVILGAGATGRLAAQHFAKLSPKRLVVLNRTVSKAEAVALEVNGVADSIDKLDHHVADADIVTCAVSAERAFLDRARMEGALENRGNRPIAMLDLGVPRNVDPSVNELQNVFVHDLKALERMVDSNLAKRKGEIPKVEAIIREEIGKVTEWQRASQAGPLIQALRQSVEQVRAEEVERATRNMSEEQRKAVDRATRAVVNKLLHGPTRHIKEAAKQPDQNAERLSVINDVFQSLAEGRSRRGDN